MKQTTFGLQTTLISIFLIAIALSLRSQHNEPAPSFKIGVSAPLSGDLAEYGAAVRNGIELATSEDPQTLQTIQFKYEDNQYDSARAVSSVRKLLTFDKVNALYVWGELSLNAVAPIVEQKKIPTVSMSIDATPAVGAQYIVRSINHPNEYAKVLFSYFR